MKKIIKRLRESEKFQQFIKRFKSLIWRVFDMGLVYMAAFMVEELSTLEVSTPWRIAAGLLAGELTKYLNSKGVKQPYENIELEDK